MGSRVGCAGAEEAMLRMRNRSRKNGKGHIDNRAEKCYGDK